MMSISKKYMYSIHVRYTGTSKDEYDSEREDMRKGEAFKETKVFSKFRRTDELLRIFLFVIYIHFII